MPPINCFEDLEIWKKSKEFDKVLYYNARKSLLIQNDYRFKSQILAASGSIMDNIAEGFERDNNKEFLVFLTYSKGSAGEVRSQLYRAIDREYIDKELGKTLIENVQQISKAINSLIKYVRNSELKGRKHK